MISDVERVLKKYPGRVPVFIDRAKLKSTIPEIDKKKFLVPRGMNISHLMYIIRKRIQLKPEQALFIFINNTLPPNSESVENMYVKHKSKDGFLYINYSTENTFG